MTLTVVVFLVLGLVLLVVSETILLYCNYMSFPILGFGLVYLYKCLLLRAVVSDVGRR